MAGFPKNGIRNLHQSRDHFWFRHRNAIIERALLESRAKAPVKEVLELGCGSCIIGEHLNRAGFVISVSDRDVSFLQYLPPRVSSLVFDMTSDPVPTEWRNSFDALVLGDVIEHLADPVSALRRSRDFLRHGGHILVTVPALPSLWSEYDLQSMHEKRYTRKTLQDELHEASFFVEYIAYFMFIPAVVLYIQRKMILKSGSARLGRDSLRISSIANAVMLRVMQFENLALKYIPVPFGSSLIAMGRKL